MTVEKLQANDLRMPVQYVKGIGPKRAKVLASVGINTVRDLLFYFPYDYIDLSAVKKISALRPFAGTSKWLTVIGTIRGFDLLGRPPHQRFVLLIQDETGTLELVFFRSLTYFKKAFTAGQVLAVSGKITAYRGRIQMVHPSIDRLSGGPNGDEDYEGFLHTSGIVPKYGSSSDLKDVNLHVKGFRRIVKSALDSFSGFIEEYLPESVLRRHQFPQLSLAITAVHFPESFEQLDAVQRRLKFDELFSTQLLLALRRKHIRSELAGISFETKSNLARKLVDSLPFSLTSAQKRVIREVTDDMKSTKPMNRLLQGDVGSGKTIIALLAMLIAVDNGYQSAFMAPTEILAEQHYRTIAGFLSGLNIDVRLLIGAQSSGMRKNILGEIKNGRAQIVVGTHAIIQEDVEFAGLGIVIIDEQHRFGVAQRVALREKGNRGGEGALQPDILIMTATPIPRTLSLTIYGDLDVSVLDELPANRKKIKTSVLYESQTRQLYAFIRSQVKQGRQAYIVYPLVEESEKLDLKASTESYEHLKSEIFTDFRVGLLHGQMISAEKDEVMNQFKDGSIDIMVTTTVIEVGIDVPNASVMVIQHAERFGLSQLHQLRGRVGRGTSQSYCILVAPDWMRKNINLSADYPAADDAERDKMRSVRRLQTMVKTTDGFKIAEIDLELRGPGDFFSTRQSGLPRLRIANLLTDGEILATARREAFELVDADPLLRHPDHQALKNYYEEWMKEDLALLQGG